MASASFSSAKSRAKMGGDVAEDQDQYGFLVEPMTDPLSVGVGDIVRQWDFRHSIRFRPL